jgi:serine/threonine-protein kinase
LKVEQLEPTPNLARSLSAVVDGQGARLFAIKIQPGFKLVLGVNGTNLMQMTVFAANGQVLDPRGPLRVVTVPKVEGSLVQVLVRNDGMAAGMISLSVRVDPPLAAPPANIQIPLPASPGGVAVPPPVAPNPPPNPATPGVQESSEPLQR